MAFHLGDYVKLSSQPKWGIGRVVSIGENEKVTIFFLCGGRRVIYSTSPQLEEAVDPGDPILELAGSADWQRANRNLYVVELDPKVFESERRFREANPHWVPGKATFRSTGSTMRHYNPNQTFKPSLVGKAQKAWRKAEMPVGNA